MIGTETKHLAAIPGQTWDECYTLFRELPEPSYDDLRNSVTARLGSAAPCIRPAVKRAQIVHEWSVAAISLARRFRKRGVPLTRVRGSVRSDGVAARTTEPRAPAHGRPTFEIAGSRRLFVRGPKHAALRSGVRRAPNSQPVHQAAKSVGVKIEDGSRALASADHPAGSLQHSQNMLALDFFE